MDIGKKAILFTLITLLMSGLFIILFSSQIRTPLNNDNELINVRIENLRSYSEDIEIYTDHILEIASYEALVALNLFFNDTGEVPANLSQLNCMFADLLDDGNLTSIGQPQLREDSLAFILGAIYDNGQDPAGSDYYEPFGDHTFAAQKFTPLVTGTLTDVELDLTFDAVMPVEITVEIFTENCSEPLYVIDTSTQEITPAAANQTGDTYFFNFQNGAELQADTTYYIVLSAPNDYYSSVAAGVNDFSNIPDGNITNLTYIDNYTYAPLAENKSLNVYMTNITEIANRTFDIRTGYSYSNPTLFQTYPWAVETKMQLQFYVENDHAQYEFTRDLTASIDIEDLYDPLFIHNKLNSNNHTQTIRKTEFLFDTDFNIVNFTIFVRDEDYRVNKGEAPSYLNRLLNMTNGSNCCGIESVMNVSRLIENSLPDVLENTSYFDYQYVDNGSVNCSDLFKINETISYLWTTNYSKARFDRWHLIELNIDNTHWIPETCP